MSSSLGWSAATNPVAPITTNTQAAEPVQQVESAPAAGIAGEFGGLDRSMFFIGNTIANLRGMDPVFLPGQTLTLIDGRSVVGGQGLVEGVRAPTSPPAQRVISCNFTLHDRARPSGRGLVGTSVPVLVDTMGGRTSMPANVGESLSACTSTGTGNEVLLVFRVMKDGRPHNFARVVDSNSKLLTEAELDQAGTVEFTVAGKQYTAQVPAP
jgi:hypothetical protein